MVKASDCWHIGTGYKSSPWHGRVELMLYSEEFWSDMLPSGISDKSGGGGPNAPPPPLSRDATVSGEYSRRGLCQSL